MSPTGFILHGLCVFTGWLWIGWIIGKEKRPTSWTVIIHIIMIAGMFVVHYLVFTETNRTPIWGSRIFTILSYFIGFYWCRNQCAANLPTPPRP